MRFKHSDIRHHLPYLHSMAFTNRDRAVVELGIGPGYSTRAIASAYPALFVTCDIRPQPVKWFRGLEEQERNGYRSYHCDSRDLATEPDVMEAIDELGLGLVFTDTLRQAMVLLGELGTWAPLVSPGGFIAVHDTVSFGHVDEGSGGGPGLRAAIADFLLERCDEWRLITSALQDNGLAILQRTISPWCFGLTGGATSTSAF